MANLVFRSTKTGKICCAASSPDALCDECAARWMASTRATARRAAEGAPAELSHEPECAPPPPDLTRAILAARAVDDGSYQARVRASFAAPRGFAPTAPPRAAGRRSVDRAVPPPPDLTAAIIAARKASEGRA